MSGQDDLPLPQLGLSEAEAASRFEALQRKLVPLWQSIRELNQGEQTIVVVPSQSVEFDCQGAEMQAYEERFLFLLLLLAPAARPHGLRHLADHPPDHHRLLLGLLPGVIASHARRRLFTRGARGPQPEAALAEAARAPAADRAHPLADPGPRPRAHRPLPRRLGARPRAAPRHPACTARPGFFPLGTKSGCRRLFAEEGVPIPLGREDLWSIEAVRRGAGRHCAQAKPGIAQGDRQAERGVSRARATPYVDLDGPAGPGAPEEPGALARARARDGLRAPSVDLRELRRQARGARRASSRSGS